MKKNYYFAAINTLGCEPYEKNSLDIGVCFEDSKLADSFIQDMIKEKSKPNGGKIISRVACVFNVEMRVVHSDCNYGFKVCNTLDEAYIELNKERVMPYHNTDEFISNEEFKHDIHVVVEYFTNRIIGVFEKKSNAVSFEQNESFTDCEIKTLRDFENHIDFRKFFFVVDNNEYAVCFSNVDAALKFMVHVNTTKDYYVSYTMLCTAENYKPKYGKILRIYNTASQASKKGVFAFESLQYNEIFNNGHSQLFHVELTDNEEKKKEIARFTSSKEAYRFIEMLKKAKTEELDIALVHGTENKNLIADFTKMLQFASSVSFENFKSVLPLLYRRPKLTDDFVDEIYRSMVGDFPKFYLGLNECQREKLLEIVSD